MFLLSCTYYYIQPPQQPPQQLSQQKIICCYVQPEEKPESKVQSEAQYWFWKNKCGKITWLGFTYDPILGIKSQVKECYKRLLFHLGICFNKISCLEQLIKEEVQEIEERYDLNRLRRGQEIEFRPSFRKYLKIDP